jgi:dTDP-glucose 4,6-dehydratase
MAKSDSPNNRVAVIGSNSFSGSDFVDILLEEGDSEVLGVSRSAEKSNLFLPYKNRNSSRFSFAQIDLNSQTDELSAIFDDFQPQYVVNFAAQSEVGPSWDNPEHWYETNVVGLSKLLSTLENKKYLEKYVHISSPEIYGAYEGSIDETAPAKPSTPYAVSKAAADMHVQIMCQERNFQAVTVRSTNVYGAHQQLFKIIPRSIIYLLTGKTIALHGGGKAVKSYIHIRDVSRGELAVMKRGRIGHVYHFAPTEGYAVRDIVQRVCDRMGKDFDSVTNDVEERLGQDKAYLIDSSKSRTELGWSPQIDLDEGLQGVIDWVSAHRDEILTQPLEYEHQR